MEQYDIATLAPLSAASPQEACILTLLTSEELEKRAGETGAEELLCHTPAARDARVCKAEAHKGFLSGTIVTPRHTRGRTPIAFGYLLTDRQMVLCDDTGAVHTLLQQAGRLNRQSGSPVGSFLYGFLEVLIAKDMHHLEELGDRLDRLEEEVLGGEPDGFNGKMAALRREISGWVRYYTQLDDTVCEFQENENAFFNEEDLRLLRLVEKRMGRLVAEAKELRDHGLQIQSLFQAELDARQNRIMKILTIVTTIFLPLTLVTGWYGMNFAGMPELTWKYGYPTVIGLSVLVVLICLWLMKKKKFW